MAMQLTPHLQFDGNCAAAFDFYARCLGGTILMMLKAGESPMAAQVPADKRDTIIHARMQVGDTLLMGADAMMGPYTPPAGFTVTLNVDDPAEAECVFAALAEGGTVRMALTETFWAHRFGVLVDRFGTPWMINCEKTPG